MVRTTGLGKVTLSPTNITRTLLTGLGKCKEADGYVKTFIESLKNTAFHARGEAYGSFSVDQAAFLKEGGALPRCTSRVVPRQWEQARLPSIPPPHSLPPPSTSIEF